MALCSQVQGDLGQLAGRMLGLRGGRAAALRITSSSGVTDAGVAGEGPGPGADGADAGSQDAPASLEEMEASLAQQVRRHSTIAVWVEKWEVVPVTVCVWYTT